MVNPYKVRGGVGCLGRLLAGLSALACVMSFGLLVFGLLLAMGPGRVDVGAMASAVRAVAVGLVAGAVAFVLGRAVRS